MNIVNFFKKTILSQRQEPFVASVDSILEDFRTKVTQLEDLIETNDEKNAALLDKKRGIETSMEQNARENARAAGVIDKLQNLLG